MKCKKCGFGNAKNSKYCANCGKSVTDNLSLSGTIIKENKFIKFLAVLLNQKIFWVASTFVSIVLIIISLSSSYVLKRKDNSTFMDVSSKNPKVETKVFEVASYFGCTCGKCNEKSLDICKCLFASEERQFIREYLEESHNISTIFDAVESKYGGLKDGVDISKISKIKEFKSFEKEKLNTQK